MLRARRVTFVAALALAGGLALTGCRSQPGMALYVGSTAYTQKYVDRLAGELAHIPGIAKADARSQVVQWLVQRDLDKRLVQRNAWAAPKIDVAGAASQFEQALQVNDTARARKAVADSQPLIQLFAEVNAYGQVTRQHAGSAKPTAADNEDLYEHAKAAGLVQGGQDEQAYIASLGAQNEQVFSSTIGLKNLYRAEVKRARVSINPKYGPADLVLLPDSNNHTLVDVPLSGNSTQPAVTAAPQDTSAAQPPVDQGGPTG